ncbi:MAG: LysM peptidoglycan-binding domain-containing protein [Pseudomonadota bacterium]
MASRGTKTGIGAAVATAVVVWFWWTLSERQEAADRPDPAVSETAIARTPVAETDPQETAQERVDPAEPPAPAQQTAAPDANPAEADPTDAEVPELATATTARPTTQAEPANPDLPLPANPDAANARSVTATPTDPPAAPGADPTAKADAESAEKPDVSAPTAQEAVDAGTEPPATVPEPGQSEVVRREPDPVPERAARPHVVDARPAAMDDAPEPGNDPNAPSAEPEPDVQAAQPSLMTPPSRDEGLDPSDVPAQQEATVPATEQAAVSSAPRAAIPPLAEIDPSETAIETPAPLSEDPPHITAPDRLAQPADRDALGSSVATLSAARPDSAVPSATTASPDAAAPGASQPAAPQAPTILSLPMLAMTDEADPTPERLAQPAAPRTELTAPVFDLVRVDSEGFTVIAGRADPGVEIDIAFDGQVRMTVRANDRGDFVAMLQAELTSEPQTVTLVARDDGPAAVVSPEPVIVLAAPATSSDAPVLPAVIQTTQERVEVVQPAHPGITDQVVLDTISYDPQGAVVLSGRGTPLAPVRIYANDSPIGEVMVSDSGAWQAILPDIAQGRYTLRVDELDNAGSRVVSRMETPFQRDDPLQAPAAVRAAIDAEAVPGSTVVVQPGNNLWMLARRHLGSGIRYTFIFTENRDRIRDPDLIYPGQIFDLPDRQQFVPETD